jgi:MFS transporter, DHA1 family, tetracycline resistance protein
MREDTKQKRQFWVILVIVFFGFVGISMPYLIFPALLLNPTYAIVPTNWSESSRGIFLGITLAVYPLGQFFGSPILGSLSDDYGRKRLLSWSLLFTAVCNLLSGLAIEWHQLWLLIVSRLMAGLMEGNIAIARAMAADMTTISKHQTFGKINAVASIGFLLGPLLGGLMADKSLLEELTTSMPFYLICILFFFLAGLSAWVLEKGVINSQSTVRTIWQRLNLIKRLSALFTNRRLQFLMITSTSFTLAVDIFYEFGPVYLTVKWGLSPAQLIVYNGVLCLALAVGNGWLATFCSSRLSNRLAIISSIGLFALCLIGAVSTNSTFLMISLFAFSGLVIGLAVTLLTVKISDSVSDSIQGEVLGVQISLRVLGDAAICLLGGLLLILSSKIILIVAAAISMGAMLYYGLARKRCYMQ